MTSSLPADTPFNKTLHVSLRHHDDVIAGGGVTAFSKTPYVSPSTGSEK